MPIALPDITISGPGLRFGGPGGFPSGREVTTFAVGDTATYLRGNHIVKFGGEVRRVKHYNFNQDPGSLHVSQRGGVPAGLRQRSSRSRSAPAPTTRTSTPSADSSRTRSRWDRTSSSISACATTTCRRRRSRTTSSSRSIRRRSSLLQIGTGGFTQVTKNGSDFQPRRGRHLESDRQRQDRRARRLRGHGQPEQHRLLHRRDRQSADRLAVFGAGQRNGGEQHQAGHRRNAGRVRRARAVVHGSELPARPHADVERQRRARVRRDGRDGRLLRIARRPPAHSDQPESVRRRRAAPSVRT